MLKSSIKIGDFNESFFCPLSYWNQSDYVNQWREGLVRLLHGKTKSVIVAEMYQPEIANYINWWVFYRENKQVYIQNHFLFTKDIGDEFSEKRLYEYIPDREIETEDGERISEWSIGLNDIEAFCQKNTF